ncbi:glycosyltransferase [bacterium]|nr:glycosyltransferase [bacterium]
MDKKTIKINFADTEKGYFNNEDNIFLDVLKEDYNIEISDKPDFLFYSCFGDNYKNFSNCVKIFFTNENIVPDFNEADYGLGFHNLQFEDRYLRFPEYFYKLPASVQNRSNLSNELAHRDFCNFIYSNSINGEGAKLRVDFCKQLQKYKFVDCIGKVLHNIDIEIEPRKGNWVDSKIQLLGNYKFTIAFENRFTNGYTTEKLYHPLMANSIPIYMGNPDIARDFNPKAFINCNDYKNFDEVIEVIKELDNNEEKYMEMLRQPAMQETYDFDGKSKLKDFLINIIGKGNNPYVRQRNSFVRFVEKNFMPIKTKGMHKVLHICGLRIKVG